MRSAFILGLVAIAGCASSPSYRSPALQVPTSFREARDTAGGTSHVAVMTSTSVSESVHQAPRSTYWEQLGDTTLNRLIADLVRANQDVQAAEARVRATRSERVRTLLDLTPDTRLSGSYARQRLSSASFPAFAGSFPDQNVWDAGVSASWDLDVFGQIRQTAQARGAMVGAAQEGLRDVQVSLTAELAVTYFELRGAQEQLNVARENAENQRRTFEITHERLEAGRGSAFDTERAQAQLSLTLASIPTREAQVAAAQYRIGVLVGRPPAAVAAELDQPGRLPGLPDVASIGNPEAVVRDRPDVAAAERQAAAQGALVGAAKASYLPRISIGGSAGYVAPELRTVGAGGTLRYAVGPVISWPLLSLGRVKADVDAAQAGEDEARAHYRAVVLSAMQDLEVSISQYRASRLRLERLEEASAASEHAAKLALLRYTEGATDLLQVLDAQRTQLEAQDRLAQARIDAGAAYAALFRAIGGR
ncbi:MAG TPA: efflux transporter outer membrane subunit [Gemmatimonadales bacterium]